MRGLSTSLKEVFGISSNLLKSYVLRHHVDDDFKDKIELTDHHIVVFGETKVGKSHLRKKYITPNKETVEIDCTKGVDLYEIYNQILYKCGIETSETLTSSIERGTRLNKDAEASLFQFLKAKLSGELTETQVISEVARKTIPKTTSVRLVEALKEKNIKFIVLDDFHYLKLVDQYLLAYDLKMFYQSGIRFIIIGTKINKGYFEKFNGELSQRIDYIDATRWSEKDLKIIKERGCEVLNIDISDEIIDYFIDASSGIVAVYQQLLSHFCIANNIRKTNEEYIVLNDLDKAIKCNENYYLTLSEHYLKRIQDIADGERKAKLKLYYYIIKVVLTSDVEIAKKGFSFQYLFDNLKNIHPIKSINHGALTSVLNHFDELQSKKDIFPKVFTYYDKRLYVSDSLFYYILKHFNKEKIDDVLPPYDFQLEFDFN
ncbi:ATP-binding protein [Bacillus haynesii]|uniref:ATP-binding protein n=1 Tax=Bacillus haynesii TaxID=1925021 RepID=UPI00345E6C7C